MLSIHEVALLRHGLVVDARHVRECDHVALESVEWRSVCVILIEVRVQWLLHLLVQ